MGKKVTVVGAGFYGSTTAQRLAEYDVFETVVLTDIIEGKPEGLALDLNVPTNQRGTRGDMDPRVVAIFKRWGFRWGGEFHTVPDPMHFELAALVRT